MIFNFLISFLISRVTSPPPHEIKDMVDDLEENFPGMKKRLCDDEGNLRNFVNVYVNGEDVRFLNGIDTELQNGNEISLVPAVAGGK